MDKIKKSNTAKPSVKKKALANSSETIKSKIARKKSSAKRIVSKNKVPKSVWKAFSNDQNQYISPKWETFGQANSRAFSHMELFEDVSLHHKIGSALGVSVSILWKAYCISEGKYISRQWETRDQANYDAQPHINAGHHIRFDQRIAG